MKFVVSLLLVISVLVPFDVSADQQEPYDTIEWIALMPEDDLTALLNPPDALLSIEDGSELDSIDNLEQIGVDEPNAKRFFQALRSTQVVESMHNKFIRLPGFVVPLVNDERNSVTEFFIVPYFGACLHLPPPPPNQIIYVKVEEGFQLESLYDAFWFEGELLVEQSEHSLGSSAYSLRLDSLYLYEE